MRFRAFATIATIAALSVCAAAAHADTFAFNAQGTGTSSSGVFSGTGTLDATLLSGNTYQINSISGTGVTGLIQPTLFHGNDNELFPGASPLVDGSGFAFTDTFGTQGSFSVDIYSANGSYFAYLTDNDMVTETDPITLSITNVAATPEPSGLLLLGTGLLGLVGLARGRLAGLRS